MQQSTVNQLFRILQTTGHQQVIKFTTHSKSQDSTIQADNHCILARHPSLTPQFHLPCIIEAIFTGLTPIFIGLKGKSTDFDFINSGSISLLTLCKGHLSLQLDDGMEKSSAY